MANSRIFVKGLPPNITEAEFQKHFSANNRHVTDVKLIPQRHIGYVGFKSPEDASQAVRYFNRSFIRMSKICVELAKPISDPIISRGYNATRSAFTVTGGGNIPQPSLGIDTNSKKRKREEPAQSDPKLLEFLHVMNGRETTMIDVSNVAHHEKHQSSEPLIAEDAGDNEYEHIPTRREKSRKVKSVIAVATQPPSRDDEVNATLPITDAHDMAAVTDTGTVNRMASMTEITDDNWLRSRSNRLLDLIEPEDLTAGMMPTPEVATPTQDMGTERDTVHSSTKETTEVAEAKTMQITQADATDAISRTRRLFVRNLPYSATEDDIRDTFDKFGPLEETEGEKANNSTQVHLPVNTAGSSKGFALLMFNHPSDALKAFQTLDGATFQGRIIHIIPASAKKQLGLYEFGISKLSLRKQNLIRKKAEAVSSTFNWNSLYMSQDAVNASVAGRLGVSKSELLDPTSADTAIKQAVAETTVIQETKEFFAANGVDLDAFKSHKRGDETILVKNFPYGTTMEELRRMFEDFGPVLQVLMPPSGTIAIVQFAQASHAKAAFGKLAYRRIKDSVLFLEKGPRDLLKTGQSEQAAKASDEAKATGVQKLSVAELLSSSSNGAEEAETSSLFIRNLNFATSTSRLAEAFRALDGFVAARVKTKMDPKRAGQTLSMGFGFVEFQSKALAQAALLAMDGYVLDGHALAVRASHKGHDAAEERRREDRAKKAAAQKTKIIVKNLPFQATKQDVRSLFGTYGQLRSVRVPKKADHTTRGFAFADFVTAREAENALNALRDTHLLGRRLVLDYAEAEAVDAEEEIAKMQRKVGGQVNKVALQQLTGGGRRKKVNIGKNEEELEE